MASHNAPVNTKPKRTSVACFSCRKLKLKCAPSKDISRCERCIQLKIQCEKGPVGSTPASQIQSSTTQPTNTFNSGSYSFSENLGAPLATATDLPYPQALPYNETTLQPTWSHPDYSQASAFPYAIETFDPSHSSYSGNSAGHVYDNYPSQQGTEDYIQPPIPAATSTPLGGEPNFPFSDNPYHHSGMHGQDPNDSQFS
ncbi:hypothetical protein H0H92_010520 [Tricholoma furcatifolium]|nr:hypothetical protein H0H92_010520 [Tricholoma furcatifolium]